MRIIIELKCNAHAIFNQLYQYRIATIHNNQQNRMYLRDFVWKEHAQLKSLLNKIRMTH